MADTVTLPGTGSVIATDDVGSAHHQYVKLEFGADGTATKVDASNPLPVTVISGGDGSVQGVDAHDAAITADPLLIGGYASAAAPTGVSADADAVRAWFLRNGAQCVNVTAAGTLVAAGGGTEATALRVTIATDSTGVVSVDDNGASLTTDATGTVAHDAVGTGAAPMLGGGYASAAAPADVSTDGDAVRGWFLRNGAQCVNVTAAGTLVAAGNGTAATALRVTLASDSTGTTAVTQATAANLNAEVQGDAAHDAAAAGNPVLVGGYASAAAPADVSADADAVRAWFLRNGSRACTITAAGALIGGDATNGLDVDVTRVIPGTSASHLGKAEDAASASGDTGVLVFAVRRDSASSGVDTDGDYAALSVDSTGQLRVVGSTAGTQYAEDAASADGHLMTTAGTVRQDTPAGSTTTDGDYQPLKTDSVGRLHVNVGSIAAGTNNIGDVDVLTLPGVAGVAAHDAAVSGNPVLIGLEARTSNGTPVASGDIVRSAADTLGKQVVLLGAQNDLTLRGLTNYTNNTGADVIAAQASGIRIAVMGILVVNGHATVGTKVSVRDGTTAKITGYAAPLGGGFSIASSTPIFISTAATAVTAICGTTGSDVDVSVWGYALNN